MIGDVVVTSPDIERFFSSLDIPGWFVGVTDRFDVWNVKVSTDGSLTGAEADECAVVGRGTVDESPGKFVVAYHCSNQPRLVRVIAAVSDETSFGLDVFALVSSYADGYALAAALQDLEIDPELIGASEGVNIGDEIRP